MTTMRDEGISDFAAHERWRLGRPTAALPLLLALGCSNGGQTGDEYSDVTREVRGSVDRLEATGPANGSASADLNDFTARFLALESEPDANTVFSPVSIAVAMSMLAAGAEGETLSEIQDALGFSTEGEEFHAARNRLLQELESRNHERSEYRSPQAVRLSDDLWIDSNECTPSDAFLNVLSANYDAGVHLTDFVAKPERAREAINAKVAEDTEGLIDELLPRGSIEESTRFVLTQAIYVKARWMEEFDANSTEPAPFETNSGESVEVPMMHAGSANGSFVETEEYTAAAFAYEWGELEFVAVMPAPGTFADFVAGLPALGIDAILEQLQPSAMDLRLPKLEIERKVPLAPRLQAMGIDRAFVDGAAEFGPICSDTFIDQVFHNAIIVIDEEGTVAAAATAVEGSESSATPEDPPSIRFDHPFVFFIRDEATNAVLFAGQFVGAE